MPCWGPRVPRGPGAQNNIIHSFIKRKALALLVLTQEETRDTGLDLRAHVSRETGVKPVPRKLIWRGPIIEDFLEEVTLGMSSHRRKRGGDPSYKRQSNMPQVGQKGHPELGWYQRILGRAETGSQEVRLSGESSILSGQLH